MKWWVTVSPRLRRSNLDPDATRLISLRTTPLDPWLSAMLSVLLNSQSDERPTRIILVDVARCFDEEQHEQLGPPVELPEPGRLPVRREQLVANLLVILLLRTQLCPPPFGQLPSAGSLCRLPLSLAVGLTVDGPVDLSGEVVVRFELVACDAMSEWLERRLVLDLLVKSIDIFGVVGWDELVE